MDEDDVMVAIDSIHAELDAQRQTLKWLLIAVSCLAIAGVLDAWKPNLKDAV